MTRWRPALEAWHGGVAVVLLIGALVVASALGLPPFSEAQPAGTTTPADPATPSASASASATPAAPGGEAPQVVAPSRTRRAGQAGGTATQQPTGEETCVAQGSDVAFTVLSFNTFSARRVVPSRMAQVAREIALWDPDIVLLQEVSRGRNGGALADQPAWYADRLGMEWSFGANDSTGPGEYGVATLSRHPIVGSSNTRLPFRPGLPKNFHRGVLNTKIEIDETTISVYNTHLQPGSSSLRVQQMRTIASVMGTDPLPQVLGGDLNSSPGSGALGVARTLLRDAWVDSGTGFALTHPAWRPKARIDYLLYSEPLRPRRTVTLRSAVSDHRGVLTSFELDATGEPICLPTFEEPLEQD